VKAISRREWLEWLAFGAVPLALAGRAAGAAWADACGRLAGTKIGWIVPNALGGGYDSYSRLIAPHLEKALSARIDIRNVPGAGGLVGAKAIVDSRPDGRTIGIINASGLLAASLAGEKRAPNPATAFTLLGRIVGSRQIWACGNDSSLRTIDDLFEAARTRPIACGTRDVGSLGFINLTLTAHVIGLNIDVVAGYEGSGAGALASARGEVDVVAYNFDSIVSHIENGDVRPLLQVANSRVSSHPSLDNVPLLGGHDGIAAGRARSQARPVEETLDDVTTVVDLLNVGRLVVGPPAMARDLSACLEEAVLEALRDPALRALADRAHLSLDVASGSDARRALVGVAGRMDKFIPVIEQAIRKLRG